MDSTTTSNESELNFTRRVSNRLLEQGVEPRPIDPQCSALRDKSCPTGQALTTSVRHGDPGNIDHALIESETQSIETSAEMDMNAGMHRSGGNQEEEQPQAAMVSHPQANVRPPSMTPLEISLIQVDCPGKATHPNKLPHQATMGFHQGRQNHLATAPFLQQETHLCHPNNNSNLTT